MKTCLIFFPWWGGILIYHSVSHEFLHLTEQLWEFTTDTAHLIQSVLFAVSKVGQIQEISIFVSEWHIRGNHSTCHLYGDQSWVFIGRTDFEAETQILWPPDAKNWLIWKDPDAGKDWGQEEKGTTEDEMVGWHHQLNGHRFGYTLGVGDGQGGLACCGSWGHKESDTTVWLNWTEPDFPWL